MQEAAALGLDYSHLALYLCGDNLYPTIRGRSTRARRRAYASQRQADGNLQSIGLRSRSGRWSITLRGCSNCIAKACAGIQARRRRILMQTMFEPIPKPSFDAEGTDRYLKWLQNRYTGDIAKLNRDYGLSASSFPALKPSEYWLRPEELNWVDCARPTAHDFAHRHT